MAVDKLERLLTLTEVLLGSERPMAIDTLRDLVPGYPDGDAPFRRMFERDKDDLRELGVPIEVVPLPDADPPQLGYRLRREEYFLRDPGLDPDELAALHLALQLVQVEGTAGNEALWAFGGVPSSGSDAPLASLPGDPRLAAMLDAIAERCPLTFEYRSRHDEVQSRTVDPVRIEYQKGHWYLTGHDHRRDAVRHFRLDRILDQHLQRGAPGSFAPPEVEAPALPTQAWRFGDGEATVAEVHIDATSAAVARQQLGPDADVREQDDGSIVVRVEVTDTAAFRTFVLGFDDHAEVLGPPALRDDLTTWLQRTVEHLRATLRSGTPPPTAGAAPSEPNASRP